MLKFIALLFFSTFLQAETSVLNLCGHSGPQNTVTSPLTKQGKNEWCFTGVCAENGKNFEKQKCLKQIEENGELHENAFAVSYREFHSEPGVSSNKGYASFYRLYPGDSCFEQCRPEGKKFLGMNTGKKLGIEKEECVKCMIKLPVKTEESYEVKGPNVTVYQGQKCFELCRLPMGDYLDHRPYSNECLSCVGTAGFKPKTEHLQNKAGECFEFRDGQYQGVSKVPEWLCKEDANLYFTYYSKSSKFAVGTLFFKQPQKCYEMDEKSRGDYYNRQIAMTYCDNESVDSSQRGSRKESPASSRASSTSPSVRKN